MLDGEDRAHHRHRARIEGQHDEEAERSQHLRNEAVLLLELHLEVPFDLLVLLHLSAEEERNGDGQRRLEDQRVSACVEAILRPLLRVSADRIHLKRTHTSSEEQDGEHRRHRKRVRRFKHHFLELALGELAAGLPARDTNSLHGSVSWLRHTVIVK